MRRPLGVTVTAVLVLLGAACTPDPDPGALADNPLTLGAGAVFGNGPATSVSMSADGDIVAFVSEADNLVPGDDNGVADVFVRRMSTGDVTRVAEGGLGEARVSPNGRFVSFRDGVLDFGVYDRVDGTTTAWTGGDNWGSRAPVVPDDGSVAISGAGSAFGLATPGCVVRDLGTGVESDCPNTHDSIEFFAASASGQFVLFNRYGTGPAELVMWDRVAGTETNTGLGGSVGNVWTSISDDGRYVTSLVAGPMIARWDLVDDVAVPMPGPTPDGTTVPTGISPDGRFIRITSSATNLHAGDVNGTFDTYIWDVETGSFDLVSTNLVTGGFLPDGGLHCGSGPGQVLAGGATCVLSDSPMNLADANGVGDGYFVG